MRKAAVSFSISAVLMLAPCIVNAKEPKMEIGLTAAGFSRAKPACDECDDVGAASIIGLGLHQYGTAYASFFIKPRLAIEPQLSFLRESQDGASESRMILAGQASYFFSGNARPSPYVCGRAGTFRAADDDDSLSQFLFGVGGGYRIPLGDRGVVRIEGRFDRIAAKTEEEDFYEWENPGVDVFSISASLGVAF
jgi:hypothetical protein